MRQTKLIFIDGLPHSGKSSTTQRIERVLTRHGIACRSFLEGASGHPIHFWNTPDMADADMFLEKSLENWIRFVKGARDRDVVNIFDASLFMSFARVLMCFKRKPEEILRLVDGVLNISEVLHPVMIYFHHTDVVGHITELCRQRGIKWGWGNMARSVLLTPYARDNGMKGPRGMVAFWSRVQDLGNELYRRISIPKISFGNPSGNWDNTCTQIGAFLDIPLEKGLFFSKEYLNKFEGRYHDRTSGRGVTVRLKNDDHLFLIGFGWPRRMIPLGLEMFCVEGTFFEVKFACSQEEPTWLEIHKEKLKDSPPRILYRV